MDVRRLHGAVPLDRRYLIYYYALTHISASRVASFSYLQPVFATSWRFPLDERLTPP